MKLGISDFAFPSGWALDKIFATAAEVGFDGVELGLTENGPVNLDSTKEDMQNIKNLADKYGIRLYSMASMLAWDYSLTSDSSEERERAKSNVKKQIELAHYLGCDTVLVVPGYVGVDFIPKCEVVAYDTVYARAAEWVNELKAYAEERKVSIGVENVWNKFLLSPLEMRDFIDKADSDYVGAYFDVGNVVYS
ncbi:MAG: sugar phosphate isomerase/epimerase, partial [Roseburia sp.]|nr:sugar phosphate isomerase/epimerase [Roseburia sp.]